MGFGYVAAERAAIEMTYEGLCTVTGFAAVQDPDTGEQQQQRVTTLLDQPCALSQTSLRTALATNSDNTIDYDAKLFIAPEIEIAAGSEIRVVQDGMDYSFEATGEPFRYPTHQEVLLKRTGKA